MTVQALVPWTEISRMLLLSPLILAVSALVAVLGLATIRGVLPLLTRRLLSPRARRILGAASIVVAVLLPFTAAFLTVTPGASYGVVLEDHTLRVYFYQDDYVEYDACRANLTLLDPEEAKSLLKLRTYGTSDPSTGIDMGYYKLATGEEATVIILWKKTSSVLLVRSGDTVSLVGVPGVEQVYRAVLEECSP